MTIIDYVKHLVRQKYDPELPTLALRFINSLFRAEPIIHCSNRLMSREALHRILRGNIEVLDILYE